MKMTQIERGRQLKLGLCCDPSWITVTWQLQATNFKTEIQIYTNVCIDLKILHDDPEF